MDESLDALTDRGLALLADIGTFVESMLLPWRLYQLAIIVGLAVLAWIVGRLLGARIRRWAQTLRGQAMWRLRILVILERRMPLIVFVVLLWSLYHVMQQITWPSRSYLIGLVATVATAWLAIALLTRLIRNSLLRRIVAWAAWIWVTIYYFGFLDETEAVLDQVALTIGEVRISLLSVLTALAITAALLTTARLTTNAVSAQFMRNPDVSPSMRLLTKKIMQVALYGLAIYIGLKAVGFDLTGLAFLSGAVGLGLGFGLQKVVSNLVSGMIILLDKSIKPGDVISLGETFGWIESLGARYVSVVTRDGKEYLIPNEDLITGQVVNWSHSNEFVRLDIYFGTAYGDDPHLVRKIAVDAAKSVRRVLSSPRPPVCHIVGFGDSSVDYILRFWISDPAEGLTNIRGNVYLALWDAFQQEGVTIPFPQREVRLLDRDPPAGITQATRSTVAPD